jgi:hypothetical protein
MSPRGEVNRRDDQIKLLHRNLSFTGTGGYTTLNAPSTRGWLDHVWGKLDRLHVVNLQNTTKSFS